MNTGSRPRYGLTFGAAAGAALLLGALCGCGSKAPAPPPTAKAPPPATEDAEPAGAAEPRYGTVLRAEPDIRAPTPATVRPGEGLSLFDGAALGGWREAKEEDFVSHGETRVKDGCVVLGQGYPYTGIRWEGNFPRESFEVAVEAKRLSGSDIFCGLTVPVGKANVTLVLGGWGDSVVGLSCVDGFNASENEATVAMSFENNRWYKVRLRVTASRIRAWIDGKQVVDQKREGHAFTIYDSLSVIRPLGFFSWETDAALRNIEMKRLPESP